MKIDKKWGTRIALCFILFGQVLFMYRYCNMKSGYFVDEIWSYGLSNSYYHAQIWEDGALDETRVDPETLEDYIVVREGEEFTYGSVMYNQTHDCHPPLFYMVLHTVSSFFPNEFSKWFGLIPNLFYFVITVLFLYKISKLFFANTYYTLVPVVMYGFSLIAVDSVTYIRMYMMWTMWSTMFAWFHLYTFVKKKVDVRMMMFLFLAAAGGLFTQYFFVIFAFPWVILYMLWLFWEKKWKDMGKYVATGCLAIAVVIGIYPTCVLAILGKQPGHSEAMYNNINNLSDFEEKWVRFNGIMDKQLFGGIMSILILVTFLFLAYYLVTRICWNVKVDRIEGGLLLEVSKRERAKKRTWKIGELQFMAGAIFVTCMFYYVIVVKISPLYYARYFMPLCPEIYLLFCLLVFAIAKLWKQSGKSILVIMMMCAILVDGYTFYKENPEYLYEEKENNPKYAAAYGDVVCAYFYAPGNIYLMINNILELVHFEDLYYICYDVFDEKLDDVEVDDKGMIVYLDNYANPVMSYEECKNRLKEKYGWQQETLLFSDDKVYVFYLYNAPNKTRELVKMETE